MSVIEPNSSTISSRDGTKLRVLSYPDPSEIKARLLFVHGWASHAARGRLPAEWFIARGYAWHAVDVRGHGKSEGMRGYVSSFDRYLDDVEAFIEAVQHQVEDDRPLLLIGHSHGGLICTRFLQQRHAGTRIAAAAVSSPFYGLKLKVPWIKRFVAERLASLLPKATVPAGDLPVTRNKEVQQAYFDDPLTFNKAPFNWVVEATRAQELALAQAGRIKHPILFMHGGADAIADPETTRQVYEACGAEDKTFTIYEGYFHEIFNEPEEDRVRVFEDLETWLEAHTEA